LKAAVSTKWWSLSTVAVVAAAAVTAAIISQMPASAATQATFYVAPTGNDSNPGTITSPFRTLQHARDVVRTVNANMSGDINVFLRGGTYPVSSTIDFGSGDSGTNGFRVIYSAFPNETPVLEGGVQVTGWTQHSGNIWKAPLDRANKLRSLYVNGKRAFMASKTMNSAGCSGRSTSRRAGRTGRGSRVRSATAPNTVRPISGHCPQPGRHRDRNGDHVDDGHRGSPPGDHGRHEPRGTVPAAGRGYRPGRVQRQLPDRR
jgi:hypothetical protein